VGFGTEILFMTVLGGLLLGPRRLHTVLRHLARVKAQFEEATRSLKSQLEVELEARHRDGNADSSQELVGDQ
jgi:Sec-independent protein translocase protein TatA